MVTKQPLIRSMRTVKRETLKLISGWVSRSNDPQMVRKALTYVTAEGDKPSWGFMLTKNEGRKLMIKMLMISEVIYLHSCVLLSYSYCSSQWNS